MRKELILLGLLLVGCLSSGIPKNDQIKPVLEKVVNNDLDTKVTDSKKILSEVNNDEKEIDSLSKNESECVKKDYPDLPQGVCKPIKFSSVGGSFYSFSNIDNNYESFIRKFRNNPYVRSINIFDNSTSH